MQDITTFRNHENIALSLTGASANDHVAFALSGLMAQLINPNLSYGGSEKRTTLGGIKSSISTHIDGITVGTNVILSILTGLESDGEMRTYAIDLKKIYDGLSLEDRINLSKPIYFMSEDPMSCESMHEKYPVLHYGREGNLRINFDQNLRYGGEDVDYVEEDVKASLRNLFRLTENLYQNGEVESFHIKTGEILIIKNHHCLHGRDGFSENNRVLLLTPFHPSPYLTLSQDYVLMSPDAIPSNPDADALRDENKGHTTSPMK